MEVESSSTVQALASSLGVKLDAIPSEFVRSEDERPGTTTFRGPVPEIPVVDLAGRDRDRIAKAVSEAAEGWGIFQVVNHGVPAEAIAALQRVGRGFFEMPREEKEKYAVEPGSGSVEGYGSRLQKEPEGKRAWVDYLFHNVWPESRIDYKFWPESPPDYRKVNQEYARYLVSVMDEMLSSLSLGLGLEGHVIKEALGGEGVELLLKINYYPPCPRPDLALGVVAHTDMSAVTLLVPNEVPGLQVFKDGHWIDAKYIPNAIIVHIGDQIEILSNGKYKSVLHRTTVNKEKVRMSWPVFCSPPDDRAVGPLPQLVSEASPAKFKTKRYKDYKYCKLNKLPQ
ncbi:flavonol synthase/flavanone 3-hydroxylase-like [Iris pallida]|uniref:Flavonol synthase/flavanone 3-hydroxylase-like n=1 Tax=Iris pallida TaxID=29817 RepID=A0AAX6EPY5_IRIPA|nr:flavonol synthase/flavanone 3-hydroxylase-like [Iris pallida]